nr:hypothetical protein [uncultured Methanoregula sp.]
MIRYGLPSILIILLLTAGCTTPLSPANTTVNATANTPQVPPQSAAMYKVTVAQPDAYSRFIRMDTDVYNIGEVVEFAVVNGGTSDLKSPNDNPGFSVIFQTGSGTWATKMGNEKPAVTNATRLRPGESSKVYRFLSDGWEAGRYRIVSDYGIERDFLIRASPTPTLAPVSACTPAANASPWIMINAIPDHAANEQFTIAGTTNIAAGKLLRYQIFAPGNGNTVVPLGEPVALTVTEGSCGNNTWSVNVMLPEPSLYLIGITDETQKTSAIRRFTILPLAPTGTGPAPAEPVAPGTPVPATPRALP